MVRFFYVLLIVFLCIAVPNQALATPHHYCQKYIEEAARKTGVLPEILWAVAKTESNFGKGPWPWTINVKGKGYFFQDKQSAQKFLKSLSPKVRYRTDVGCMQLNWGYHGSAFPKLSTMLNPRLNVLYAAYFLKDVYEETGRWAKAVSVYHSRNWSHGGQYANHVAHLIQDYEKQMRTNHEKSVE
jgi:hypothetical protein